MRVALVGLGDIARKAYLPTLATRPDVVPVLVTRNPAALAELGDAYRVPERFSALGPAIASGLDAAFVCAATEAHPALVAELLRAGVPTHVDKPLAYGAQTAAELVELAERRQVSLQVGFNRRCAPAYQEVAGWADRDVVLLQKHRAHQPGPARQVVFDDFIHVVDTLRWLVPDPAGDPVVSFRTEAGQLARLAVQWTAGSRLALGLMDRASGLTEEILEVSAPGRRCRVHELAAVVDLTGGETLRRRDEWRPVAEQRGFAQLADRFLAAVDRGELLSAYDALRTHEVCEAILSRCAG